MFIDTVTVVGGARADVGGSRHAGPAVVHLFPRTGVLVLDAVVTVEIITTV